MYSLHPVKVEPHVVLSLVLYKLVDGNADVREDAFHMLQVLSMREWKTSASDLAAAASAAVGHGKGRHRAQEEALTLEADADGSVLVLSTLQDSYQQFQHELSVGLARWVGAAGVTGSAS